MTKHRSRRRLYFLLGIAVVVGAGVLGYLEFALARPVGEGPAGPKVDKSQFADVWTDRRVRIIGIGDSVTAGLGAKSPSHTFLQPNAAESTR